MLMKIDFISKSTFCNLYLIKQIKPIKLHEGKIKYLGNNFIYNDALET